MSYQPDFEKIAYKIVNTCIGVKKGQNILIQGRSDTQDFSELIALECSKRGALPVLNLTSDNYTCRNLTEVPIEYLSNTPNHLLEMVKNTDLLITIGMEPKNPKLFDNIPEERVGKYRIGRKPIREEIFTNPRCSWVGTDYPTPEQAKVYNIPFLQFFEFYWKAMDTDYEKMRQSATKLVSLIEGAGEVTIHSKKGTDLTFSIKGRPLDIDDGFLADSFQRKALNLPSGEVCCAPIEDTANGIAIFDIAFYHSKPIRDLVIEFKKGKATPLQAKAGLDVFCSVLENSHGDRDIIAELGIGLNPDIPKPIGFMLTDEKIMSTVHIAIGENRMMGGKNNSDLHWDLLMIEPDLYMDNKPIMKQGAFLL